MYSLAKLYQDQGKSAQAESLWIETLGIARRVMGENHLLTQGVRTWLVPLYLNQHQWDQSIDILTQSLEAGNEEPTGRFVDRLRQMKMLMSLAQCFEKVGRVEEAVERFRQSVELGEELVAERPDDPTLPNDLAWALATFPVERVRDPLQAVTLAGRAAELEPRNAMYLNTLGVAQYRAEDWRGAIDTLGRSVPLNADHASYDFFFLAMAHWQLGERDEARSWFERAVVWMDEHLPRDDELRRIRDEATALLGVEEMK